MTRIIHPRPVPGRQVFIGIEFRDGVADLDMEQTSPHVIDSLRMHRFTFEESAHAVEPSKSSKSQRKREVVQAENAPENTSTTPDGTDSDEESNTDSIVSSADLSIFHTGD